MSNLTDFISGSKGIPASIVNAYNTLGLDEFFTTSVDNTTFFDIGEKYNLHIPSTTAIGSYTLADMSFFDLIDADSNFLYAIASSSANNITAILKIDITDSATGIVSVVTTNYYFYRYMKNNNYIILYSTNSNNQKPGHQILPYKLSDDTFHSYVSNYSANDFNPSGPGSSANSTGVTGYIIHPDLLTNKCYMFNSVATSGYNTNDSYTLATFFDFNDPDNIIVSKVIDDSSSYNSGTHSASTVSVIDHGVTRYVNWGNSDISTNTNSDLTTPPPGTLDRYTKPTNYPFYSTTNTNNTKRMIKLNGTDFSNYENTNLANLYGLVTNYIRGKATTKINKIVFPETYKLANYNTTTKYIEGIYTTGDFSSGYNLIIKNLANVKTTLADMDTTLETFGNIIIRKTTLTYDPTMKIINLISKTNANYESKNVFIVFEEVDTGIKHKLQLKYDGSLSKFSNDIYLHTGVYKGDYYIYITVDEAIDLSLDTNNVFLGDITSKISK